MNLALVRPIDVQFMETPFYGSRQVTRHLRNRGYCVRRKGLWRLMARMGLSAVCQRSHRVWCADMTFIPLRRSYLYLVAIMEWATRRALV